jgi:hypothetical protein
MVVVALALLVLASACEFKQLDDGGYSIKPTNPNGERLLIIGDSLIRQPSLSIGFSLIPAGVETLVQAVNASGLASGSVHWDARATELINSFHPTVVIIGLSGNLSPPYWDGYAPPGADNSPEWFAWISATKASSEFIDRNVRAAISLTGVFQRSGARVHWIETPPFPPEFQQPTVPDRLWPRLMTELKAARPGVSLLSARSSISDAAGHWTQFKMICGSVYEIRSRGWDGGVHFTTDGSGTYGRAVARVLSQAEGWPAPPSQCPGLPD